MKPQIGVIGSSGELMQESCEKLAGEIGEEIAKRKYTLVFGPERDRDSLPTVAARAARNAGGDVLGILYGSGKKGIPDCITHLVCTATERGGPRETSFIASCDVVIAIGGGSGTLTEMAIAYQKSIPIIAMTGTGGWADKMAGQYFDERKRMPVYSAKTAEEAVKLAEELANQKED